MKGELVPEPMQVFPEPFLRRRLEGHVHQRFPSLPAWRRKVSDDGAEELIAQDAVILPYPFAYLMDHARHRTERVELGSSESPPHFGLPRRLGRLRFGECGVSIDRVLAVVVGEGEGQHEITHVLRHSGISPEGRRVERFQRREQFALLAETADGRRGAAALRAHFVPFGPRGSSVSGRHSPRMS